ncbi:UDP-glucosyltransferase 29-like [Ziziphus jujuba]|uniref:UDP-glucosyltransferase 29-like n=1 Tax=Ziziphus jujuba TaxID=326968 RepID=A0A6P3ZET4_ZIZJJ|nr:UDP-glucosyltransferase 29-like [Ziziphus jujuba]
MDATKRSMRVLMLPWLAYGHITPFLELAKKLAQRNFQIFFCSSPVNLNSIKHKISDHPNKPNNSIQFVELHLPSLPSLPQENHTMKGLPFLLFPILLKALDMTKPQLSDIIQTLKPDLIIYDVLPLWIPDLASSLNIPSIAIITGGVAFVCVMSFYHVEDDKHVDEREFPFPELYPDHLRIKFSQMRKLPPLSDEQGRDMSPLSMYKKSNSIILVKSREELEGKYMDYLSASFGKRIVPLGPLVPELVNNDNEGMDIINWLNKKEKSPTVLVTVGSELSMGKEDMVEMAHGLELSNVNFIWVIRFNEGENIKIEDVLPNGFLERTTERGLIVENWIPQMKILSHENIGGFVSHCGWGSVMESIKFGVPIIAVPWALDGPWNARVVEVSGIGLEIERENKNGKLLRESVAKVIKQVVVEKSGEEIRRKAKEMSESIRMKDEEVTNRVVKELLQLCDS